jgi:hypothetical protein
MQKGGVTLIPTKQRELGLPQSSQTLIKWHINEANLSLATTDLEE